MKKIYFQSNAYNEIYASNNPHRFKVLLNKDLIRLSSSDFVVYAAVKAICFNRKKSSAKVLGLKSDLIIKHTCFGTIYDDIISSFVLKENLVSENKEEEEEESEQVFISFPNPQFFPTNTHSLSSCSFSVFNLQDSSDSLDYVDVNFPLSIEIWVTEGSMNDPSPPFHTLIKSSDAESGKIYPQNTNVNFNFHLPENKHLTGHWSLSLRNLIISSKIFNIQDDSFKIRFSTFIYRLKGQDGQYYGQEQNKNVGSYIRPGYYKNNQKLIKEVNRVVMQLTKNKVKITLKEESKCVINYSQLEKGIKKFYSLKFKSKLAVLLGFVKEESLYFDKNFVLVPKIEERNTIEADHKIKLFSYRPKQILLLCNIIEPSLFGSRMAPILSFIPVDYILRKEGNDGIFSLFPSEQTHHKININSFGHIHFWFEDENGKAVNMKGNNTDTYITLSFSPRRQI